MGDFSANFRSMDEDDEDESESDDDEDVDRNKAVDDGDNGKICMDLEKRPKLKGYAPSHV